MASDMKRAVQELRALRQQLDEMERAAREPIAVIGMAGRFPGADTLEAFWAPPREGLLVEGAWEALEDAGVVPARIERGAGGVFVGISNADYAHLHTRAGDQ